MTSIPLRKRLFDLGGAAAGLLAFSPVMAVRGGGHRPGGRVAGAVPPGAPGLERRAFTILKFRSMRDGRITRVGRILRATGLDELPQFINVLRER